jgi:hypothetical protein
MILVIACAVALAITKHVDPFAFFPQTILLSSDLIVELWIEKWILPMLISLVVAFLVIRLRRPRPPLRRLRRQPGSIVLALGVFATFVVGLLGLVRSLSLELRPSEMLREATTLGGMLILGSWLTLIFSGRFRCSPDWIEQVSILLGSCWIVTLLSQWVCTRILGYLI